MIKAEVLMIGDWVFMDNRPIRVTKLSQYGEYSNCEAIPLTKEILEKNEFEYILDRYIWKKGKEKPIHLKWLKTFWGLDINCDTIPMELHYVHELQHALRLCGIEKTIEL